MARPSVRAGRTRDDRGLPANTTSLSLSTTMAMGCPGARAATYPDVAKAAADGFSCQANQRSLLAESSTTGVLPR